MPKIKTNEIIRMLRESIEPKMNQTEMGKKLGISQRVMSAIERGENEPDNETIRNICLYYNISADYILGLTDEPKKLYENKKPRKQG